jgi:serine/threonine protein kinase/tetratricopeptide (TPR) repeat protein
MKCPKCQAGNPETVKFCGECGTALSPAEPIFSSTETLASPLQELNRGAIVAGRYEIIEELGHGGMGKVYRVEDTKIKAEIALKLIKPEIAADRKTIERFANELKTTRMISHRNVCRMFDLGEDKGTYFITMEYVPGQDLRGLIRQTGQLTIGKAVAIAKQISEGLTEAHRLGVIHRDLKPSNIIIDKDGNARIMDFGIARSLRAKSLTGEGMIIGTPEYMSPEQVEGKEADQRSDIYSLGTILYEMLTGRVPFEGDTPLSVAVKQKAEKPQEPKKLNEQIPDELNRLILRCLEKERERRYQSAEELRSGLENIEKGLPATTHEMPRRKPFTSKQVTVTIGPKKLLVPALGILALVVLAVVVWRILPKGHFAPPPSSGKPTLAILYFENLSGDKTLDPWKTALTELLITKLSQSKYINVLSSDRVFSLLKRLNLHEARKYSTEDLVKAADESGATYTLSGSLMKAGQRIIITLTLQRPRTGEVVSPLNAECSGEEEIFPKVDELAIKIKSDLNLTPDQIAADIDKEVGKITTTSPEAYKYYSEGRKYHNNGEYRESISSIEKATAIDPGFAMAYRSLANAYSNLGYSAEARKCFQKAFELSDRVSDRERYIIQGDYYRESQKTYDKAIEVYNQLLTLYPEDAIGNNNLAMLYLDLEEWDKAIALHDTVIQNKDDTFYSYVLKADLYCAKGLYNKAREAPELYINRFGDNFNIRWALSYVEFFQENFASALLELEKALQLRPRDNDAVWLKGYVYLCQGDFRKAEQDFQRLLDSEEKSYHLDGRIGFASLYQLQGKFGEAIKQLRSGAEEARELSAWSNEASMHLRLAYLEMRSGNHVEAIKECDQAGALAAANELSSTERWSLLAKAMIFLEMNEVEKAQQAAAELKSIIDKQMNKKLVRMSDFLSGMIELKKNNPGKAIEYSEKAVSLMPFQYSSNQEHALFLDCLAQACYRSGDLDKASRQYEKITTLTSGRTAWGDIYAKSFYMLGKIAEQQGDKPRARENYQKFLGLRKDADPGIPEVDDAKKRLAGI